MTHIKLIIKDIKTAHILHMFKKRMKNMNMMRKKREFTKKFQTENLNMKNIWNKKTNPPKNKKENNGQD